MISLLSINQAETIVLNLQITQVNISGIRNPICVIYDITYAY